MHVQHVQLLKLMIIVLPSFFVGGYIIPLLIRMTKSKVSEGWTTFILSCFCSLILLYNLAATYPLPESISASLSSLLSALLGIVIFFAINKLGSE